MWNLELDNTNCFGMQGYGMSTVSYQKSTFGGIFKNEVAQLETGFNWDM